MDGTLLRIYNGTCRRLGVSPEVRAGALAYVWYAWNHHANARKVAFSTHCWRRILSYLAGCDVPHGKRRRREPLDYSRSFIRADEAICRESAVVEEALAIIGWQNLRERLTSTQRRVVLAILRRRRANRAKRELHMHPERIKRILRIVEPILSQCF